MNRKTYSEILDSVARDHLPANPDLAPRIRSRIQKGKGFAMQPRMKIVATVILVLLILALVLVSAPAVAAAIQHWFGYVPGFGLVREGGIRQLAAPVAVEREGITITVERALLDSEKTMILFKVENLPAPAFPSDSKLAVCVGSDPASAGRPGAHRRGRRSRLQLGNQLRISFFLSRYSCGCGPRSSILALYRNDPGR